VIRFSAALVVVAIGVLIAGVATSSLLLVYVAIGISAVALLVLAAGVALKRDELFRDDVRPASDVDGATAGQQAVLGHQPASSGSGGKASESRVPVPAAGGAFGSAFSPGDSARGDSARGDSARGDSTRGDNARGGSARGDSVWGDLASRDEVPARPGSGAGRPASTSPESTSQGTPARPAAWPAAESGFPGVPAAKAATPPPAARSGTRRPPAPPTRADPILPWSDSLPTRVNITKGSSPDPVPSWLEDVDDESASARSASAAGATPLANRPPATTDDARGSADAPATAQAGSGGTAQADDESASTRRTSSGSPASGTLAATWSALGFGDEAPDEPAAETSRAAADAPRSWDDASWKADSGTDDDVAATAATAGEVGIDDDAAASDTDDAGTGIDDTYVDTESTGVDDGAGLDDAPDSAPAGSGPAASGLTGADEGEAEPGNVRDPSGAQQVSVVPGVPRYHDPNCILIRFMPTDDVQHMSVPEAEEAGCTPCRACQSE
jgi:hypothetical protein